MNQSLGLGPQSLGLGLETLSLGLVLGLETQGLGLGLGLVDPSLDYITVTHLVGDSGDSAYALFDNAADVGICPVICCWVPTFLKLNRASVR